MSDNLGRIFSACAVMALLWVLVYWWWEPAEPRIRFDADRPTPVTAEDQDAHSTPRPQSSDRTRPSRGRGPELAVVPPAFRQYTVKSGDTLTRIATRELGSSRHADAISRANPYVNFEQIRAGRVILIPLDPANIQGLPVATAPEPAATAPGEAMLEYTVKPGDTLSRIAHAHYGSIRYADLIFQANRDRMRSIDQLSVGQQLRLPPKPD